MRLLLKSKWEVLNRCLTYDAICHPLSTSAGLPAGVSRCKHNRIDNVVQVRMARLADWVLPMNALVQSHTPRLRSLATAEWIAAMAHVAPARFEHVLGLH
jgi:hypothetical protein